MIQHSKAIMAVSVYIGDLVRREFARHKTPVPKGSALDQAGLLDCESIVEGYVAAGEWGCAVDHLTYVVDELELELAPPHGEALQSLTQLTSAKG